MPFWHVRTFAGGMIIVGQIIQAYNMWMTARGAGTQEMPSTQPLSTQAAG
ncbi:MAG: hypothetical protein R3C68_14660 [Myxococcota bacterium]